MRLSSNFFLQVLVTTTILISSIQQCQAETLSGKVVAISDGDTITVLDTSNQLYKIRLSGIGAPEKKQAFVQRSKGHLSRLIYGKPDEVEWTKRDKYKRIVGKVLVAEPDCRWEDCPKSLDAGLNQVTVGLAWWYRKYSRERYLGDDTLSAVEYPQAIPLEALQVGRFDTKFRTLTVVVSIGLPP